jgi:hypothetical protein
MSIFRNCPLLGNQKHEEFSNELPVRFYTCDDDELGTEQVNNLASSAYAPLNNYMRSKIW